MQTKNLVSVVIPSYNRAHCIERAVRSVLDQAYKNIEVIVVDDGSEDNTRDILNAIGDPRLRYVYQDNQGACAARNRGVELARGKYVAFHDSDDLWHSTKLEKQVAVLDRDIADVVFCKQYRDDGDHMTLIPRYIHAGPVTKNTDLIGIGTQTIIAKKSVLEKERFDPKMPRFQEFEWIYRVLDTYRVFCIGEGLVDYCINPDSISSDSGKGYQAVAYLIRKYPRLKWESPMTAMHLVKDLMTWNKKAAEKGDKTVKYTHLIPKIYPGAVRYGIARMKNDAEASQWYMQVD